MARKQVNTWYDAPKPGSMGDASQDDDRVEVAVVAPNYGLEHVSYLLDVPGYRHSVLRRLPLQRLEKNGTFWDTTPIVLPTRAKLTHTFNMLPFNGPPFVATFEAELPFYLGDKRAWQHKIGHKIMASDRCRALVCLSDTGAENARRKYTDLGLPEIVAKISTFRGGVKSSKTTFPRDYSSAAEPLKLIFVGGDGLRKGIEPLLAALEHMRANGIDVELTIISSLPDESYAVRGVPSHHSEIMATLQNEPWITHHASMPYDDVRATMANHDVFVLPSLDETLGWVVIEAAMEGIPSVTSNIFAFPELIEDGKTGRIIPIEINGDKRWPALFEADMSAGWTKAKAELETGLTQALSELAQDRKKVMHWGAAAKAKMDALYAPEVAAYALKDIYDRALSGPVN